MTCLQAEARRITLAARTIAPEARCTLRGQPSHRIHSRYLRTLSDVAWQRIPVTSHLHVRRFSCDERSYKRTIFAERLPGLVDHYARRTDRLDDWLTHVSFALGGEAGARLLEELGAKVSGDTLPKHIRYFTFEEAAAPRIVSVDDFSFRRGRRSGAIVVDLECHRLVDIIPDRSSETFANCFTQHAGVEVVSRDRSGEYADAVRRRLRLTR